MKFQPGKLYSLLDLFGGRVICDKCGDESEASLTPTMLKESARAAGWLVESEEGGQDVCPRCQKREAAMKEKAA